LKVFVWFKKNHFVLCLVCFAVCFTSCNRKVSKNKRDEDNFQSKQEVVVETSKNGALNEQISQEEKQLLKLSTSAAEQAEEIKNDLSELENKNEENSDDENKKTQLEELNVINQNQQLVFSEYDDEIVYTEKEDNRQIIIYANKKNVIRNFYDEEYRLEKKENWEISDVKNSKLLKSEVYEYKEGEYKPFSKKIETEKTVEKLTFNNKGLVSESQEFKIIDSKNYITAKTEWTYNSDLKISEINKIEYVYDTEDSKKYKKTLKKKYVYKYHPKNETDEEIKPDYSYFEDGELKIKETNSSEKGKYSVLVNFDRHRSVETYYENYLKKKEVFLTDGKNIRVKNYDE